MTVEGQAAQLHAEAGLGANVHGYAQPQACLVQPRQSLQRQQHSDLVVQPIVPRYMLDAGKPGRPNVAISSRDMAREAGFFCLWS